MRSLVFETYGRLGCEGIKLLRDLVTTAAGNGAVQPTRCWMMADPAGADADVDGHFGQGLARWELLSGPLLLLLCCRQSRALAFFLSTGYAFTRLSCELTSDIDRDQRQRQRESDRERVIERESDRESDSE